MRLRLRTPDGASCRVDLDGAPTLADLRAAVGAPGAAFSLNSTVWRAVWRLGGVQRMAERVAEGLGGAPPPRPRPP